MEIGIQDLHQYPGGGVAPFDVYFRFNFTGHDHAGLKFFVQFWRLFFEFNVYDVRHWNYELSKWVEHPDEEERVGCDAAQDSAWLHGGDANPDGLGSTLDDNERNTY
jgi:hypothetical protein